jgi:hypothetical protein
MSSTELVALDQARHALEQASTVVEVLDVHDKAAALHAYAKSAGLGLEAQNKAAEWKLRAQRKAGELLAETLIRNRPSEVYQAGTLLDDLGITRNESSRWQKVARVPEADFETYLANATEAGVEITQAAALRLAPPPQSTRPPEPVRKTAIGWNGGTIELGAVGKEEYEPPVGSVAHITMLVRFDRIEDRMGYRVHSFTPVDVKLQTWCVPGSGFYYAPDENGALVRIEDDGKGPDQSETSPADLEESA